MVQQVDNDFPFNQQGVTGSGQAREQNRLQEITRARINNEENQEEDENQNRVRDPQDQVNITREGEPPGEGNLAEEIATRGANLQRAIQEGFEEDDRNEERNQPALDTPSQSIEDINPDIEATDAVPQAQQNIPGPSNSQRAVEDAQEAADQAERNAQTAFEPPSQNIENITVNSSGVTQVTDGGGNPNAQPEEVSLRPPEQNLDSTFEEPAFQAPSQDIDNIDLNSNPELQRAADEDGENVEPPAARQNENEAREDQENAQQDPEPVQTQRGQNIDRLI
jgi:hypothetical protein